MQLSLFTYLPVLVKISIRQVNKQSCTLSILGIPTFYENDVYARYNIFTEKKE